MKFVALFVASALIAAPKMSAPELIALAKKDPQSAIFREALSASLTDKAIDSGTAVLGEGTDFIWAVKSASEPTLTIDDNPGPRMWRVERSELWYATGAMDAGLSHSFSYKINGAKFGGRNDVAAYGPDSYSRPGVPQGKLSDKLTHVSKIYDGMMSEYWIYVPAQYDPAKPAALMVWQDGAGHTQRDGGSRTLNVVDNLIHQGKIPVMIQVFTFKYLDRRVFLMTPIHHHFEMKAWSETKIMVRFWIIGAILCTIGFVLYYRYYLRFKL